MLIVILDDGEFESGRPKTFGLQRRIADLGHNVMLLNEKDLGFDLHETRSEQYLEKCASKAAAWLDDLYLKNCANQQVRFILDLGWGNDPDFGKRVLRLLDKKNLVDAGKLAIISRLNTPNDRTDVEALGRQIGVKVGYFDRFTNEFSMLIKFLIDNE